MGQGVGIGVMGQAVGVTGLGYRVGVMRQVLKKKIQKGYERTNEQTDKLSDFVTS